MRRTLLGFVALCSVVVLAYLAVAGWGISFDVTAERSATLSSATKRVLDAVDRRIQITAFFPREFPGRVEAATLLSRYRDANRRITFRILDPNVVPGEAQRLGIQESGNAAVEDIAGERAEVAQYAIEIDLTSAIARLLRDTSGTVCFAAGHGERDVDDDGPRGLAEAAAVLRSNGYKLETIDLLTSPRVPRQCDAVVVAAPRSEFGRKARRALAGARNLLVLADPDAKADLNAIVERWRMRFLTGVVVEGAEGAHLPQDLTAPIVSRYAGGSPVVRGLAPTFFPRAMGVETLRSNDPGLTVTELAQTSDVSYLDRNDFENFDPKVDVEGPIGLGASADDSEVVGGEIKRTRVLAWGDADFASNAFIRDGANASLWIQGVDWLTQPEDLVAAVPSFPKVRELELTEARSRYTLFLTSGVVPGLFLIAGAMVWVLRRSR